MPISQELIGKRLKEARENARLTQDAVAQTIGLPRTAIVQIEAGNRSVSTMELVRLADLFKRPVAEFFAESEVHEDDILVALFRSAPQIQDNPGYRAEVEMCIDLCREGAILERLLGKDHRHGPPGYKLSQPSRSAEAVRQGNEIAQAERRRLDLGDDPIANIAELVGSQGVWAASVPLTDEMSGLFLNDSSFGLSILVNLQHPPTRRRFSYAHEYAHALLDSGLNVTISSQGNRTELLEVRANAFAASFLMPAEGVKDFLESLDKGKGSRIEHEVYDVLVERGNEAPVRAQSRSIPGASKITFQDAAQLSRYFGVSYQAAVYRLRNLDRINQSQCETLIGRNNEASTYLRFLKNKDGEGTSHSEHEYDRELISAILYLAVEAYRRGEIGRGRLLEIGKKLSIPADDLLLLGQAAIEE